MRRSRHWLWLLLLVPIGLGLARMRFDVEVLNLLPQRSPVVQGLKLYQEHFANARELIVAVASPDAAKTEAAARLLAESWREQTHLVRHATWQPPWMESPAESSEFLAYLWLNQTTAHFSNVLQRLSEPALSQALTDARGRLATSFSPRELALLGYDPLQLTALPESADSQAFGTGEQLFASTNGTFRVVFVEAAPDLSGYKACLAWLESIQSVEATLRQSGQLAPEISVHYTGRPAFVSEIAGGMERDMNASIAGTMILICILFYLFHRRWKPLLWLLTLLVLILGATMAIGALIFTTVSVISLGFAAILLGLAVDYGLVLYQEAQAQPASTPAQLRRLLGPSILWSATTTAAAFALLNLSSLPGLSQLGTLVAVGVLLGGMVMLLAFLPPLLHPDTNRPEAPRPPQEIPDVSKHGKTIPWMATMIVVLGSTFLWWKLPPQFDHSADALRPANSPAYATVETIKKELGRPQEPMWILISGSDSTEVLHKLTQTEKVLSQAQLDGLIHQYTLPTPLWPHRERQQQNLAAFSSRRPDTNQLQATFAAQGFAASSLALTERFLTTWQNAAQNEGLFWPTNQGSQWILGQTTARTTDQWIALGLVYIPDEGAPNEANLETLRFRLAEVGATLSGWTMLGPSLFGTVKKELFRVLIPMTVMLMLCLGLAFRGTVGILLSAATIFVSACGLFLVMQATHWSWNLMNLMALPLLLGVGVDYSIHIQLAMKRHAGHVGKVRRSTGRALLLCAATTATGFGSLGLSSNAGLASLGQVCAVGLISCYLTAVYLLPIWWKWINSFNQKAVEDHPGFRG